MATDFFQRQTEARRTSKWLVGVFILAVISIVATTMLATALVTGFVQEHPTYRGYQLERQPFPWEETLISGVAALGLIVGGSLFKIAQLSRGGTVVAEQLGGRRVYPNTVDPVERRLLNIVEEMALASGTPVPAVFLLHEEQGINAFAAGHSVSDCVIGVTRGCAEQLTRDQLQGVVAHEFSHILNGDMRLSLRLMGVLFGILLLGLTGRELLRWASLGGGRSDSRRNNGGLYLLAIGLTFMILGFLGMFFGSLIKAAVSRQREYLADASAVQFTRNPGGIAGALKRIGAAVFGSKLICSKAAEASHMYFASGVASMFATHPPLAKRILAIEPDWDGKYPAALPADAVAGFDSPGAEGFIEGMAAATSLGVYNRPVPVPTVQHAARQVAHPTEIHRVYVQQLLADIPQPLLDAAHEPYGARALLYALLLDDNAEIRAAQLKSLEKNADPNVFELTLRLAKSVQQLDVRGQLPLIDMTLPALRSLSVSQYNQFIQRFLALVDADRRISLFEWTLHHILLRHLRPQFEKVPPPQIRFYGLQQLGQQCSVLLSALARVSQRDPEVAFEAGAKQLPEAKLKMLPPEACGLNELDVALRDLAQVVPKQRARLVGACASCICADSAVSVTECELLRAICDMLDCPMPPLVAGQEVSPSLFAKPQASGVS